MQASRFCAGDSPYAVRYTVNTVYDARAVANCVIDLSLEYDKQLTHLSLQKILYFLHGHYLRNSRDGLVDGYFEAWQYGPVHPLIFSAFKNSKGRRIVDRAKRLDVMTGSYHDIDPVDDKQVRLFIRKNAAHYLDMSAGRLVDLSHAKLSPWDIVTKDGNTRIFGDRINNDLIRQHFHRHIVSIGDAPTCGEPVDEQPPS